jgi:hypothetical protein
MRIDTGSFRDFRDEMGQIPSEITHKCSVHPQTLLPSERHHGLPDKDTLPKSPDTDDLDIPDLTTLTVMDPVEEGDS